DLEQRQPPRELLERRERRLSLAKRVLRDTHVELSLVVARILLVDQHQLFERFFILARLKANAAKFKDRRDILVLGFFGVLFDRAFDEANTRVAISSERALDEVLERADRSHRRIGRNLIVRERERLVMLIKDLVGEIALKLLQINHRASAIVFFPGETAFANINDPGGNRYSAVASFARDAVSP